MTCACLARAGELWRTDLEYTLEIMRFRAECGRECQAENMHGTLVDRKLSTCLLVINQVAYP